MLREQENRDQSHVIMSGIHFKISRSVAKRIIVVGLFLAAISIGIGWYGFPALLNSKINQV